MSFGAFTPKPRVIQEPAHELNPVAEAVNTDKSQLNNFKTPGDTVPNMLVNYAGQQLTVGVAGAMATMQIGVPHDHPKFPPIKKVNARFKSGEYFPAWGLVQGRIEWLQDPTFHYIPGFSRYVINQQGEIRNGHNGTVITTNLYNGQPLKLIADGKSQVPFNARLGVLTAMAYSTLPEDFTDFTFGALSHYSNMTTPDGKTAWSPVQPVTVLSLVDQTLSHFKSSHEFLASCIAPKDYEEARNIRNAIRAMKWDAVIPAGEYMLARGTIATADEMRTRMSQAAQSAPAASAAPQTGTYDPNASLNF